jgi:hypothetical protein
MNKSILDPSFQYRPSHATDIRKTFERIREQLKRTTVPERRVLALKQPSTLRKEHS